MSLCLIVRIEYAEILVQSYPMKCCNFVMKIIAPHPYLPYALLHLYSNEFSLVEDENEA